MIDYGKSRENQKGQALLFVVVAMTVALAVGVSVSLRTLSSISRVSTTDTAARVLAAAEGGIERFLSYPISDLEDLVGVCDGAYGDLHQDVPSECQVRFPPITGEDTIESRAVITVERLSDSSTFDFTIAEGDVREINLDSYGSSAIYVCWAGDSSDLYYTVYGDSRTVVLRGIRCPTSGCASGDVEVPGGPSPIASGSNGSCGSDYPNVFQITNLGNTGNVMGMRLRSLGDASAVRVVSASGFLPLQGYKIISLGELAQNGVVQATKLVTVRRSLPYLPGQFDFGIYSNGGL